MSDVLEPEVFKAGEYIIREGTSGDTFYILAEGDVRVSKRSEDEDEIIRDLTKGDYFGEQVVGKDFFLCHLDIFSGSSKD